VPMVEPLYRRPDWVRRVNGMGPGVGGARHLVSLDPDELVATARRATGLDDFGPDTWEEPFRRLVAALDGESRLHVVGRLMSRHDLLRHLCTRLLVIDALARDPGIAEERIESPVFITGPARSGTSILQELLGEDPQLRPPLAWEMAHPFPPGDGRPDERASWAEAEFELWADVQPEFAAIHEMAARLPEECLWLFAPEFEGTFWATCTDVMSFLAWRSASDIEPCYRFHKTMLQVLQRGRSPRPWVLKSPVHLARLPLVFATYPDARVIVTHRDPARTVPSTISTLAAGRHTRCDDVDPMQIAATAGYGLRATLGALTAARSTLPAGRVADVQYLDLLRDPVGTISRACEQLGLAFTPAFAASIEAYLAARPQTKHGVHRYSAADYGLDPEALRSDFAGYMTTFGVAAEPGA
jgi:hypothetical protein